MCFYLVYVNNDVTLDIFSISPLTGPSSKLLIMGVHLERQIKAGS